MQLFLKNNIFKVLSNLFEPESNYKDFLGLIKSLILVFFVLRLLQIFLLSNT